MVWFCEWYRTWFDPHRHPSHLVWHNEILYAVIKEDEQFIGRWYLLIDYMLHMYVCIGRWFQLYATVSIQLPDEEGLQVQRLDRSIRVGTRSIR